MIIDLIAQITNTKTEEVLEGAKITQLHIEQNSNSLKDGTFIITKTKESYLWKKI